MITPKALANSSPGLERSDNPGFRYLKYRINPERVPSATNPLRVWFIFRNVDPGLSLRFNPGAGISQRLRRYRLGWLGGLGDLHRQLIGSYIITIENQL